MISPEEAVATLIAMSKRWANDYSNTCSYVVNTSKFKQSYPTQHREFKLDSTLPTVTGPKQLNTTAIATKKSH
jgi:hypothetical protein